MDSTATTISSEIFRLLTLEELHSLESMIEDAVSPYKKFCNLHKIDLPDNWTMIFHSSFTHEVPFEIKDRIIFSHIAVDKHNNPAIFVIDRDVMNNKHMLILKEDIMASK